MEIESQLHIASEICSEPADVETVDTYEDQVSHYQSMDYTYIPMPKNMKYYNVDQGWLRDIHQNQIINEDTHLMDVLRKMMDYPFLLIDYVDVEGYYEFEVNGEIRLINKAYFGIKEPTEIKLEYSGEEFSLDEIKEKIDESELLSAHDIQEKYPGEVGDLVRPYEEQYGIITLVDINKRGIKQMLYKIISQLSSDLAEKIESEHPDSEDIFQHMRPITIGRWRKDRINGLNMHISEHMNLLEMMQVIQASDEYFVHSCGFSSKKDVETLNSINDIRNRVMHANRSLIYERKEIENILSVINDAQSILSDLSNPGK